MSVEDTAASRAFAVYLVAEVRAELWASGWTQARLAEASGIPATTLSAHLNLRGRGFTFPELAAICEAMGVDIVALSKRAELAAGLIEP